jgi:hypothetical protein
MKSFKLLLSLIALVAFAAAPVIRAEGTATTATAGDSKLTSEQQAKIAALVKEEHKALKELKADTKIKDADKKAKAKAIREDYKAQIEAVKAGK